MLRMMNPFEPEDKDLLFRDLLGALNLLVTVIEDGLYEGGHYPTNAPLLYAKSVAARAEKRLDQEPVEAK